MEIMPTYRFVNNETGEEFEDFMSISALDVYLNENKNIQNINDNQQYMKKVQSN